MDTACTAAPGGFDGIDMHRQQLPDGILPSIKTQGKYFRCKAYDDMVLESS